MVFERKRYQFGYVRQKKRKTGPHVWVWEYRDHSGSHSVILGTVEQLTEAEAWKATEGRRLILNDPQVAEQVSFGAVLDRSLARVFCRRLLVTMRNRILKYFRAWRSGALRVGTILKSARLFRHSNTLFVLIEQQGKLPEETPQAGQVAFEKEAGHP